MPLKKPSSALAKPGFLSKKGIMGYRKSCTPSGTAVVPSVGSASPQSPRDRHRRKRGVRSKATKDIGGSVLQKPGRFLEDSMPLRVLLPPLKSDSSTAKIFSLDKKTMSPDQDTTTDNNVTEDNSIHVEEYECGVSVAGSEKQEWAFTLYDFDGRGKITKDDLAQLLRSLYDAVGSSISLPQTGTKSLKLKLTVSPDKTQQNNVAVTSSSPKAALPKTAHTPSPAEKASVAKRKSSSKHHTAKDGTNNSKQTNNSASGKQDIKKSNVQQLDSGLSQGQNNLSAGTRDAATRDAATRVTGTADARTGVTGTGVTGTGVTGTGVTGTGDAAMTNTEKKQLVELVQKNMEKHQQRQQRKVRRRTTEPPSRRPPQENVARRNYYMDLAGIDHQPEDDTHKLLNTSAPVILDSQQSSRRKASNKHHHRFKRDKRTTPGRTTPGLQKRDVEEQPQEDVDLTILDNCVNKEIERTAEQLVLMQDASVAGVVSGGTGVVTGGTGGGRSPRLSSKVSAMVSTPKSNHRVRPSSSVLPVAMIKDSVAASPHHQRRHRHRDKQHQRAMQQVAAWIEREHSLSPVMHEQSVIQRHEHHHIHEHHHHHHYHHYHET